MNFIKRLVALLIVFTMLMSMPSFADEAEDIYAYLSSLGIMVGDETGDFREEDTLTRAEFSAIAARLLRVPDIKQAQIFEDVPSDHWANGYISQMYKMGMINGTGNGNFSPDSPVTYEQAIKILVNVLGYGEEAEKKGGYPSGYIGVGVSLRLNSDLSIKGENLIRSEIAQMVYNTLQANPLTSYGTPDYSKENRTLGQIISSSMDVVRIAGIVTQTHKASLVSTKPSLIKGEATIDAILIHTDTDLKVGYYAEIYAEKTRGRINLVNVNYPEGRNNVTVANAKGASLASGIFTYIDEEDKERKLRVGSADYMYNGRKTAGFISIADGTYTLIDNNLDNIIDVVYIDEPESFVVNRVNKAKSMVYFDRSVIFRGRNGINLDLEDDEKIISLKNKDGVDLTVSDIEAGNAITIKQSTDGSYIEAVVSSDALEGEIEEISDKGFVINGNEYEVAYAKGIDYSSKFSLTDTGVFTLDCFGRLVGIDEAEKSSDFLYAYCMDAQEVTGLEASIWLKTIYASAPLKEVNVKDDTEEISYKFQNNDPEDFRLAKKLKLNGTPCDDTDVDYSRLKNSFVAFKTNSNGEIKELYYESLTGRGRIQYDFNAKIMSFGGENDTRGYMTDKNTTFVLIPETVRTTEDYMVEVTIKQKTTQKVYGTVFFADDEYESVELQPVDILMIKSDLMNSSEPVTFTDDDSVCIVGSVRSASGSIRDDEGAEVYKITLLDGTELKEEVTASHGRAFDIASTLRKGDLIRYKKDGFGRINNIEKICSLNGLKDNTGKYVYDNNIRLGNGKEARFGIVYKTMINSFDHSSNKLVDKLNLSYEQDGSYTLDSSDEIKISRDGDVPVYLYNLTTGWIEPGNLEDAVASMYASAEVSSKVYIYYRQPDAPTAVVIIED